MIKVPLLNKNTLSKIRNQLSLNTTPKVERNNRRSFSFLGFSAQPMLKKEKPIMFTPSSKQLLFSFTNENKRVLKKIKKEKVQLLTISDQFQKDIKLITDETSRMIKTLRQAKNDIENDFHSHRTLTKNKTVDNISKKIASPMFRTSSNITIFSNKLKKKAFQNTTNQITKEETEDSFNSDNNRTKSLSSSMSFQVRKNRFTFNLNSLIKQNKNFYLVPVQFLSSLSMRNLTEDYKHTFIIDRLNLLLDNLNFFRDEYLPGSLLSQAFDNLSKDFQVKYNKTIELLCALCLEIPKIILGDFYLSVDQFLYCKIPSLREYKCKNYESEAEIFISNLKLFCEVTTFIGSCKEVYELLIKKVEHLKTTDKQFKLLEHYLNFSRYYSSSICSMARTYIEKFNKDKEFLKKFEEEANLRPKSKPKVTDLLTRLHERGKVKEQELSKKIFRIENALHFNKRNYEEVFQKRRKKMERDKYINVKSMLHSNLVTKLLKYVNKSTKDRIITQRIVDRYRKRENKE